MNEKEFYKTSSELLAKRVANLVEELNFKKGEIQLLQKNQKVLVVS